MIFHAADIGTLVPATDALGRRTRGHCHINALTRAGRSDGTGRRRATVQPRFRGNERKAPDRSFNSLVKRSNDSWVNHTFELFISSNNTYWPEFIAGGSCLGIATPGIN